MIEGLFCGWHPPSLLTADHFVNAQAQQACGYLDLDYISLAMAHKSAAYW